MTEIASAQDFRTAVCAAVRDAVAQRARRLVLVDADFQDWPLDELELIDALTDFVRLPGRGLLLLARSFDHVVRAHPRFVAWRRTWGHAIDARRPDDEQITLPTALLVDRALAVELLDRVHWRGRVLAGDARTIALAEDIDAFAQRSEPAFAATTLGL